MDLKRGNRMSDREKIKQELEVRIIKDEFKEGEPMLSVSNLSEEYEISSTTAMMIYNEMKMEGTLIAKQGTCTMVAPNCKAVLHEKHMNKFREILKTLYEYANDIGVDFQQEVDEIKNTK
jgi:GntR family transcriptional regulator